MKKILLVLVFLMIFPGCLSSFSVLKKVDFSFPSDVYSIIESNYKMLNTFTGKGFILVNSPEGKFQANLNTSISVKDSLCLLKFTGALGINIAKFLLLKNEFDLLDERENILYKGEKENLNIDEVTYINIPLSDFFDLFTGACNLDGNFVSKREEIVPDPENKSLSLIEGDICIKYEISEMLGIVKKFTKTKNKKLIYTKEFSNFRKLSGVILPQKIVYKITGENYRESTRITIVYRIQKLNKKINKNDFNISLPKNVKVEHLN